MASRSWLTTLIERLNRRSERQDEPEHFLSQDTSGERRARAKKIQAALESEANVLNVR
jgi:hypothetical protein